MQHFSEILTLLGVAGLTIPLLQRLGLSPVLGYLLCGIIIGPHGLGAAREAFPWVRFLTVADNEVMRSFAELGTVLLMFVIGLKFSLNDLWRMRAHVLGLGSCQVLLTGFAVALIARVFGNTIEMSILLGACFALSSTAVVMQMLEEKKRMNTPVGKLAFSILFMQDLAVVPILALLTAFAVRGEGSVALIAIQALAMACAAMIIVYFLGVKILRPLLSRFDAEHKSEWLMSFTLFLILAMATLTEFMGLSAALGAFLAGTLLAETEHRQEVMAVITPVKGLLLGIFFMSIGMMIDMKEVMSNPGWVFLSVIGIGAIKVAVLFPLCLLFGVKKSVAAESAVLLGQGGEFVFVIVAMALSYGVISHQNAQFFMLVTAFSLILTPPMAAFATRIGKETVRRFGD